MHVIRALAAGTATAGLIAGGLIGATGAHADSYKQASVHTIFSDEFWLCGKNQYHQTVCTPLIESPNDWKRVYGWWWTGKVEFTGRQYHSDGSVSVRYRTCDSAKHQHDQFFDCYAI